MPEKFQATTFVILTRKTKRCQLIADYALDYGDAMQKIEVLGKLVMSGELHEATLIGGNVTKNYGPLDRSLFNGYSHDQPHQDDDILIGQGN